MEISSSSFCSALIYRCKKIHKSASKLALLFTIILDYAIKFTQLIMKYWLKLIERDNTKYLLTIYKNHLR